MSLKRRLIVSNAAVVIIPVLITIAASFAFILVSSKVFNANVSYENIERLTRVEYEFFGMDWSLFKENPERLNDKEFQEYLAARVSAISGDIAVLKKHEIVFSTVALNKIDIEKCLEAGRKGASWKTVQLRGGSYIVKVSPIAFKNGEQGSTILLVPLEKVDVTSGKFLLFTLIIFLVSFFLTNLLFAFIFSKSILSPLARLQAAAGEISMGNLDYEVIEEGDIEIKELCRSFEQMRIKLKKSVYTQMKYDDNRKMLVSSISHDLKTPITSIKGYVEGIIDGVASTPEKVEKYLRTVYSKADQVDSMIDDLLLYSKLDLNQIPFNFERTDIVKYFEDCIAENEHELEKADIKLKLENSVKECRYAMIDRERVRRVIINILDNAKKYMNKPEGRIDIILRESSSSIIVEIKDNGAGIPGESLQHIFDRFYRADTARSRVSGSGLGLAIARQIIEGHNGKIWVKSRENEGTSIMISLVKMR